MSDTLSLSDYVARPVRSLAEVRVELAERLELVGDNGASMIRASKLREWIAILDEAIGRRG